MMEHMKHVRDKYKVPAKRGMTVHSDGRRGLIVAARGGHLRVQLLNQPGLIWCHPFNVDYLDGDAWISGAEKAAEYNAAWDRFNARLSKRQPPASAPTPAPAWEREAAAARCDGVVLRGAQ